MKSLSSQGRGHGFDSWSVNEDTSCGMVWSRRKICGPLPNICISLKFPTLSQTVFKLKDFYFAQIVPCNLVSSTLEFSLTKPK